VVMVVAWPWVSMVEVSGVFFFLYGFLGFLLIYGFLGFDGHEFVVGVSRKRHYGWVYLEEASICA